MTNKIKSLGIALVAVAALGMVAASAVQASEVHFTSGGSTSIFGRQTQVHKWQFTKPGINVQCTQALFEGTQMGAGGSQTTTQDITLTPTYTGCTCFGVACQVKVNGCKYTITGAGQPALTAKMDIVGCTAGLRMEFVTAIGIVTVGEQATIGGHILLANEGVHPFQALNAIFALQGITYQCHGAIPGCASGLQTTDGDYTGQVTFEGRVDQGGVANSEHNGHKYQKLSQSGSQVGLQAT